MCYNEILTVEKNLDKGKMNVEKNKFNCYSCFRD